LPALINETNSHKRTILFQFELIAKMGRGYQGDIAVDNIQITPGDCGKVSAFVVNSTHCISETPNMFKDRMCKPTSVGCFVALILTPFPHRYTSAVSPTDGHITAVRQLPSFLCSPVQTFLLLKWLTHE